MGADAAAPTGMSKEIPSITPGLAIGYRDLG